MGRLWLVLFESDVAVGRAKLSRQDSVAYQVMAQCWVVLLGGFPPWSFEAATAALHLEVEFEWIRRVQATSSVFRACWLVVVWVVERCGL